MLNNVLSFAGAGNDPALRTAVEAARAAADTASAEAAAARRTADQALANAGGPALLLWRGTALEPGVMATAKSLPQSATSFVDGIFDVQQAQVIPAWRNHATAVAGWSNFDSSSGLTATDLVGLPAAQFVPAGVFIHQGAVAGELSASDGADGDFVRISCVVSTASPNDADPDLRTVMVIFQQQGSEVAYTNVGVDCLDGTAVNFGIGGTAASGSDLVVPENSVFFNVEQLSANVYLCTVTVQVEMWQSDGYVLDISANNVESDSVRPTIIASTPVISVASSLNELHDPHHWLPAQTGPGAPLTVDLAAGGFNTAVPLTACASIEPPATFAGQCPLAVGNGTWEAWVTLESSGAPRLHVDDGANADHADGPTSGLFVVDFPNRGCKWLASVVIEVTRTAVTLMIEGKIVATVLLGATDGPTAPAGVLTRMVLGARLDRSTAPFEGITGRAAIGDGYGRMWTAPQDLFTGLLTSSHLTALTVRDPRWMYAESV
jgi:hypothetical protein